MDQKVVEYIQNVAQRNRDWLNRRTNAEDLIALISEVENVFTGQRELDEKLISQIKLNSDYESQRFLDDIFSFNIVQATGINPYTIDSPIVRKLVHKSHFTNSQHNRDGLTNHIRRYIFQQLTQDETLDKKAFINFLHTQQFSDEDIVVIVTEFTNPFYQTDQYNRRRNNLAELAEKKLTKFSEFLLPLLQPSKSFLGVKSNNGFKKIIDQQIFKEQGSSDKRIYWLNFLSDHYPESLENQYYDFLLYKDYNSKSIVDLNCLLFLVNKDAAKFESLVLRAMQEGEIQAGCKYSVLKLLNEKLNGKYRDEIIALGESHFSYYKTTNYKGSYYSEPYTFSGPMSEAYTDYLIQQDKANAQERVERLFNESLFLNYTYFKYVNEKFGEMAITWLITALEKDPDNLPSNVDNYYYPAIFTILDQYNVSEHMGKIIEFSIKLAGKKSRELACKAVSKYEDPALAYATQLVIGKTVDQRVTGALILSNIESENVAAILNDAVDKEINDDTRDIMLEALHDKRFHTAYTKQQVVDMIGKAEARKKLSKWNEKWIEEEKLPRLYWQQTKESVTPQQIRFILYRMKRARGLNSDIEAKQLFNLLDKKRSQAFAKTMLAAFQDSNADSKLKYYLTIAALLGHDDMMHSLNTLFKKSIADKRVKMAEFVIGALAMVGTDKALRHVEVIYRKFANKKPAISLAAQEALTAAATELSISMDELADRIIPDFDFDGMYKNFVVDDHEYRAFISSDFKLNYFTEDNKIRKSAPANIDKELKIEFKEIEKEINAVIKTQSGRLEKYLVEERRWAADNWKTFFFGNPIMFVYALKLIWGVYDQEGNLLNTFYCSEDTSLYDVKDDEVIPEDDQFIGILHPVYLKPEVLSQWKDKAYSMGFVTIFHVLERPVFTVDEKEKDQTYTKKFFGETVPKGADFVNTFLVKQHWIKSTGDGGSSEFTRNFKDGQVRAYANIEGPAAYYQGGNTPAKVFEISFVKKDWKDKIALKDISAVFYSEVVADIDQLVKTQ